MVGRPTTMIEFLLESFARYDDAVAMRFDDGRSPVDLTYRTLLQRTRRETRRLAEQGVRRGSVVALLTGDDPRTFVLRWAANTLGAAVVVFADGYAAPALSRLLRTVRADLLLTTTDRHGLGLDAAPDRVPVLDVQAAPPPPDDSPVPAAAEVGDLASVSLTGGSTGVPKGVARRVTPPPPAELLDDWRDVVQLLCTPVAHIGGTIAQVVLAAGGRVVLQPGPFDPGRALAAIERDRVTTIQLLPALLHRLLDHPDLDATDTAALRRVNLGSAPAVPERITEAIERIGPVISQTYGSIEATNICQTTAEELARSPELRHTVGRPEPGVELSLRDEAGREVATGTVGEVRVRSRGVMSGYLNDPAQSAAVLRDGWFHTGDLGRLDDAGYLTLVGRSKDVIIAEHGKVSPVEVEHALLTHPAVASVGVCGLAVDGVERIAAAVVLRPGPAPRPAELAAWVGARHGSNLAPATVDVVEDLPATPTGKIDRPALRRRLGG